MKLSSSSVKAGEPVSVEADVTNTSSIAGDEVAELYLTQPKLADTPNRILAGFTRIHLAPGQVTHVGLTIGPRSIAQVDAKGTRSVLPGKYAVFLGGSQPDKTSLSSIFTVTGTAELAK
jgi:beta-glucosidase